MLASACTCVRACVWVCSCFRVYHSYTLVWLSMYLLLIFDTYWKCQTKGPDNLCFFGSNPLLGVGKYVLRTW